MRFPLHSVQKQFFPYNRHKFIVSTFFSPTVCQHCGDAILGLIRQGVRCSVCNFSCHHRCQDLVEVRCAPDSFEIDHTSAASLSHPHDWLEIQTVRPVGCRACGGVAVGTHFCCKTCSYICHPKCQFAVRAECLDSTTPPTDGIPAKLIIRVVSAQGLMVADLTGSSDPYINLRVGSVVVRTRTIIQTLDPLWNGPEDVFALYAGLFLLHCF